MEACDAMHGQARGWREEVGVGNEEKKIVLTTPLTISSIKVKDPQV
jgi:hypothetical protein